MDKIKNGFAYFVQSITGIIPSFNPLIENILKNFIQKLIGQYVDIKQFQFKSIEDIQFENVNLKKEEINSKYLERSPFFMTYGQVGSMRIQVPIQNLFGQSIKVQINQVEIHLRPNGNNITHYYFEKQMQDLKNKLEKESKEAAENLFSDEYDPNKMNELKTLLMQIALNINASIKNVIIKVFLSPEMDHSSSEEVYFMFRISQIQTVDEQKVSQIKTNSHIYDNLEISQLEQSHMGASMLQPPPLQHQRQSDKPQEQVKTVNVVVKDIDLFLLKDSSLNPGEYENQQHSKPQSSAQHKKELKFPYSYPTKNHPTNLLHIPEIITNVQNPMNTQQKIKLMVSVESFEMMVEPYQIKFIGKMIDIIQNWKKQVESLKLLFITTDEKIRKLIISNNQKCTGQQQNVEEEDYFKSLKKKREDEDMDEILFKTMIEINKTQKDVPQIQNHHSIEKQQQQQQNKSDFFNNSIMVQNPTALQNLEKKNSECVDLEQSAYFNQSQLGKIIDPSIQQFISQAGNSFQNSKAKEISLQFQLKKCGIYVLKGSERCFKNNTSTEYSREWKYSPSKTSSSQSNHANPSDYVRQDSKVYSTVNTFIPCSYFMLKLNKLELNFSNSQQQKKFEIDVNSIKLMDVLLMHSEQNHHQIFKRKHSDSKSHSQDNVQQSKISSTFWKSKINDSDAPSSLKQGKQQLIKYQIDKSSHYCVNYLVYYKHDFQSKGKKEKKKYIHENVKIQSLLNNFWQREKKERKKRFEHEKQQKEKNERSEYEINIMKQYETEYGKLKGDFANIPQTSSLQFLNQGSSEKESLFTMISNKKQKEVQYNLPQFGVASDENEEQKKQKEGEKDELSQPEDVIASVHIDNLFINFDFKILHDIALISSPLSKYSHFSEQLYKGLDQIIPKYEQPLEIKKLIKSLNKNSFELEFKVNLLSFNLLTYGFKDFFIASKNVDNIYGDYAQWGCLCEVQDSKHISKYYTVSKEAKEKRGSYRPNYLNISLQKLQLLHIQKKDLNINFNEINVFSVNHPQEKSHKIIHIGKNFVLTQKNNQNYLELTYPSILKYRHKCEGSKDVVETLSQQILTTTEPLQKIDIQNLSDPSFMSSSQQVNRGEKSEHLKGSLEQFKNSKVGFSVPHSVFPKQQQQQHEGIPSDTFYKDEEQNPDISLVKIGLNIGIPVLELYILDDDLSALGEIVFSMLTWMNVIDQFKYKAQSYKNFFENIESSIVHAKDNFLIRIISSEINLYFSDPNKVLEKKDLIRTSFQASDEFRLSSDPILQKCLILHLKDASVELLLNKEIKKEEQLKNFKMTMKMSIGVNSLMLIDNSLPTLHQSNIKEKQQSQQPLQINNKADFLKNIHLFRVRSVFIRTLKQENVLIYKMNLSPQSQCCYQELYNIYSSKDNDKADGDENAVENKLMPKQMILAVKNIQERINSFDNQLSIQMIFKKKQHEVQFCQANSKQQLDIRGLCLNQSVVSIIPLSQSILILAFFESLQKFMLFDKINSDVMVKNEFKEILLRDFILFRDVKLDLFPTPSYILLSPQEQAKQKFNNKTDDRFLSPYRAIVSIDKLHIAKFQKKEQRDCTLMSKIQRINGQSDEDFMKKLKNVIRQQIVVKKISDIIDIKASKITLDVLHQLEQNTQVDPLMIDFMFGQQSDLVVSSLGFSRLVTLFEFELNKPNSQQTKLKVDSIQIGLYKDTKAHLPRLIESLNLQIKYNLLLLKNPIEDIKNSKLKIENKDIELQHNIYFTKVVEHNESFKKAEKALNSLAQKKNRFETLEEYDEIDEDEVEEKKQNDQGPELKKRQSSKFDTSFEIIDDMDIIKINEDLLKEKEKISVDIQFVKIFLYEGLDLDFVQTNTRYNVNQELFVYNEQTSVLPQKNVKVNIEQQEPEFKQVVVDQSYPKKDSVVIPSQMLNFNINSDHIEKPLKSPKQGDSSQQQRFGSFQSYQNYLQIRKKIPKNSSKHILLSIENISFQMKQYEDNDQQIKSFFKIKINKLFADNGLLNHTLLCSEQTDSSLPQEFLTLTFFIKQEEVIKSKEGSSSKSEKEKSKKSEVVKYILTSLQQVEFRIHDIIKLNLSAQAGEFLMKFFESSSNQTQNPEINPAQLNQENDDQQEIRQNIDSEEPQQKYDRIKKKTYIEYIEIPQITILLNNKQEGFNFSTLSRKEGFLQIINIGEFSEIAIILQSLSLSQRQVSKIGKVAVNQWKKEIIGNQKWSVISKLPLIKNVANIGEGIYDLFYLPISYYQQGKNVFVGTYQGVKKFVTNTTQEGMNITTGVLSSIGTLLIKNAKGASSIISQAKNYFSDKSDSASSNKKQ